MLRLIDSFWRAAAYCLHPRVIVLSLLPLALMVALSLVLGWLFWQDAIDAVRGMLESADWLVAAWAWLQRVGAGGLKSVVAPLVVIFAVTPLLVMVTLLGVALLMTPALTALVAQRRFAALERRGGSNFWQGVLLALGSTLAALAATLVSMPLWLVPPLALVLPPLIWGWLACQVLGFDVLAAHASAEERRQILHARRWPLLVMGMIAGYLGALPSLLWAAGAATLIFAPLLIVVSVWLYTLVFAFATCWFAHYTLADLQRLRAASSGPANSRDGPAAPVPAALTPPS